MTIDDPPRFIVSRILFDRTAALDLLVYLSILVQAAFHQRGTIGLEEVLAGKLAVLVVVEFRGLGRPVPRV